MKEFLEFIQSIKWHVSVVVVIWLGLRAWVAVVRMRLEYHRESPLPTLDPEYDDDQGPVPEPAPDPPRSSRGTLTGTRPSGRPPSRRRLGG